MADKPTSHRVIALLNELGIRRTEITVPHLAAVQAFANELQWDRSEIMAANYAKMVAMMRQQRDGFRIPRNNHGLGAKHSDEARHCMAELLDWFLVNHFDPRPMPKVSAVMASGGFKLDVSWGKDDARPFDVVDMEEIVMSRTIMRPLRANRELWKSVKVICHGTAIGWGEPREPRCNDPNEDDYEIDFSAGGLRDLAEEQHPYRGKGTAAKL